MANVELVIKIPEEVKNRLCFGVTYQKDIQTVCEALQNSTPLPKGHGVLKDIDAMINKLCTQEASEFFGSTTCAEILDFIDDEKPIVEADKEGSEE